MPSKEARANQYDKIFRENMEAALPGIIRNLLGIKVISSEEIPDDIQHTKERKPDLLKKITDSTDRIFILHIEYQVKNEREMVFRMAEYKVMLLRKYGLPIEQFVLFMGISTPRMVTEINEDRLIFSYQLIAISKVNYQVFLESDKPEERMLAILANFEKDDEDAALHNVLKAVQASTNGDFAESRYFKQLRILAQLRKLDVKFIEAMETITKYFKEERDPLYRRGETKGIEKGKEQVIENLVLKLGLSDEQVADVAEVPIDFVKELRASLDKKK